MHHVQTGFQLKNKDQTYKYTRGMSDSSGLLDERSHRKSIQSTRDITCNSQQPPKK